MNADDFVFALPEELIAAYPPEKRGESRLLVLRADPARPPEHRQFRELAEYLHPGDVLVMNDSRVIPARLYARRPGGGLTEILLLDEEPGSTPATPRWRALMKPGRKAPAGARFVIAPGRFEAEVVTVHDNGERTVAFHCHEDFRALLREFGQMPLPPYIMSRRRKLTHRPQDKLTGDTDRERYQTVYARPEGSVAAPTAGLHFTPEMLELLRERGIEETWVTLHVGAGTFTGMEPGSRVEDHHMHTERYDIPEEAAATINRARTEGRRIVAVGTTTVRTLESSIDIDTGQVLSGPGQTALMIAPGYKFRVADALLTNFHLPRSTLLLLVSAIAGRQRLLAAYEEAIREKYRFFSYGDAMFMEIRPQ